MALTNFAALSDEQLTVWSRRFWSEARNRSFVMPFAGDSENAMIQRITELTQTNSGNRCVITLVNEATGDGIVGDNQAKGNEEALGQDDNVVLYDQIRFAHANTGRMADQKAVVKFRNVAKDQIANRHQQVMDELAFLTLSGVAYTFKPDGTTRVGSQLSQLEYAADVSAPTAARHRRWDATSGLVAGDTSAVDTPDTPTWEMLVDIKAYAQNTYLKPIRTDDGIDVWNVFLSVDGMAALKKDDNFLAAWKDARERGESNPIFKGTPHGGKRGIYIDGLNIMEYRNVFHPSTWGSGGNISGQRILVCGAQALGFADPMGIGAPGWDEEKDDYNNRYGIAGRKVYGFKKPTFFNTYTQSVEDFGVLCVDTAV
jgi:N4-gp56 family major capsid protein